MMITTSRACGMIEQSSHRNQRDGDMSYHIAVEPAVPTSTLASAMLTGGCVKALRMALYLPE